MANEAKKPAEAKKPETKKDPKLVNPVLGWTLYGAAVVICVGAALLFWL